MAHGHQDVYGELAKTIHSSEANVCSLATIHCNSKTLFSVLPLIHQYTVTTLQDTQTCCLATSQYSVQYECLHTSDMSYC